MWARRALAAHTRGVSTLRSLEREKPVYITTPIFYVNGLPHLGHLYTAALSDVLARWYRMRGSDVHFLTGTDEHGTKVGDAAAKRGEAPGEYCDRISDEFRQAFDKFDISYDRFIRTTEKEHKLTVAEIWNTLCERRSIYPGEHQGWYCVSDETFLPSKMVVDGVDHNGNQCKISKESGHPVTWMSEKNYVFKLSDFQERLSAWLQGDEVTVYPPSRLNEALAFVKGGLNDISVSRSADNVRWAISVPGDDSQTVYVWLDALCNYVTGAGGVGGRAWPPDHQVVGKDIIKFHLVYWPAFLMAAGLPLPKAFHVHAHWTVNRQKMSKSIGNVVSPDDLHSTYGVDPVRYFILREGGMSDDGDFSRDGLVERLNAELADTFGNLVLRATAKSMLPDGRIPTPRTTTAAEDELYTALNQAAGTIDVHYRQLDISGGLKHLMGVLRLANRYFSDAEPWKLNKKTDPASQERLATVMYSTVEAVRICSALLQPVCPGTMSRVLTHVGVAEEHQNDASLLHVGGYDALRTAETRVGKKIKLFQKL